MQVIFVDEGLMKGCIYQVINRFCFTMLTNKCSIYRDNKYNLSLSYVQCIIHIYISAFSYVFCLLKATVTVC